MKENSKRCFGSAPGKEFYAEYHDKEWGIPVYDDRRLFEMLILEGAQAGLSWETILKRREEYRQVFHRFDPVKVANMTDDELNSHLTRLGGHLD
jgi:DNA-3-methyladenine glycosylase I